MGTRLNGNDVTKAEMKKTLTFFLKIFITERPKYGLVKINFNTLRFDFREKQNFEFLSQF